MYIVNGKAAPDPIVSVLPQLNAPSARVKDVFILIAGVIDKPAELFKVRFAICAGEPAKVPASVCAAVPANMRLQFAVLAVIVPELLYEPRKVILFPAKVDVVAVLLFVNAPHICIAPDTVNI